MTEKIKQSVIDIININFIFLVVPSIARSQYDSDGMAQDLISESSISSVMTIKTSAAVLSTTIIVPIIENNDTKKLNGTITKQTYKKGI
jgi:hypothetical protein